MRSIQSILSVLVIVAAFCLLSVGSVMAQGQGQGNGQGLVNNTGLANGQGFANGQGHLNGNSAVNTAPVCNQSCMQEAIALVEASVVRDFGGRLAFTTDNLDCTFTTLWQSGINCVETLAMPTGSSGNCSVYIISTTIVVCQN